VPTRLTPLRPYGDSVAVTRNLRRVSLHSEPAAIWPEIFATDYDERVQMVADIPFYVGLARQATGPVVELAVGTGRVAVPVARAIGRKVLGIDASPAMLDRTRTRAQQAGVELELLQADLRDLELAEPAALIYCPFRSLLHLKTWADRRRVFERVARSLLPNGRFAWNAFAFDHRFAAAHDEVPVEGEFTRLTRFAVGENRVDMVRSDGAISSLWWATKNEWLGLIDVAGLEVEALFGGFNHEPFTDESREYVFVTRLRRT
jgi:SAM-dependent methyltransferase